jgi:hypothetical protein
MPAKNNGEHQSRTVRETEKGESMSNRVSENSATSLRASFSAVLLLLAIGYIGIGYFQYFKSNVPDGRMRWQESAYLLRGINPFDVIQNKIEPIPEIGYPGKVGGTMPWAYILSNVVLPGFLPWNIVFWYAIVVYSGFLALMIFVVRKYAKEIFEDNTLVLTALGAVLAQYAWLTGILHGNHSLAVCPCLIVVSLMDSKKHPFVAGMLLAMAMIKPQVAALFFLPFLVERQWKPIITAGAVLLVSWIAAALLAKTGPLTMLSDIFVQGTGYATTSRHVYYGLFDPLVLFFDVLPKYLMLAEMPFFVAVTAYLLHKFKKAPRCVWFSIPAVFSTMWMYNHTYDMSVVALLSLSCILAFYEYETNVVQKILLMACIITILAPIKHGFYEISFLVPLVQRIGLLSGLYAVLSATSRQPKRTTGTSARSADLGV